LSVGFNGILQDSVISSQLRDSIETVVMPRYLLALRILGFSERLYGILFDRILSDSEGFVKVIFERLIVRPFHGIC